MQASAVTKFGLLKYHMLRLYINYGKCVSLANYKFYLLKKIVIILIWLKKSITTAQLWCFIQTSFCFKYVSKTLAGLKFPGYFPGYFPGIQHTLFERLYHLLYMNMIVIWLLNQ
jgi:hypothetical protein